MVTNALKERVCLSVSLSLLGKQTTKGDGFETRCAISLYESQSNQRGFWPKRKPKSAIFFPHFLEAVMNLGPYLLFKQIPKSPEIQITPVSHVVNSHLSGTLIEH